MKLVVSPVTVDEMIEKQWREFNGDSAVGDVPQKLVWDGINLTHRFESERHITSWLFDKQSSVPKAGRNVIFEMKNGVPRYTGIVTLHKRPGGWLTATDMMRYLYDKPRGITNYKVVVTITPALNSLVQKNVQVLQQQSLDAINRANRRGFASTYSQTVKTEADKASQRLYSGDIALRMTLCYLITEDSPEDVGISCKRLQSRFPLPADMEIEEDYVYETWLQCHPQLSFSLPLFKPYNRALPFYASNMPALTPLMKITSPDEEGLEFITEDEGTLFYLDFYKYHRHMLLLAATRGGKSVEFAKILLLAMCTNIPMVVVDYPRESGDSTFGPITSLLGDNGAYLNIAEESNNFFELPDLSRFSEDQIEMRMAEIKDYVLDLLMIIMFGATDTKIDRENRTARSILGNFINVFYDDPKIAARFQAAIGAPIGSSEWKNVPTLKDFTNICNRQTLSMLLESSEIPEEHLQLTNELRLRYESFMKTTVGRSMSQPTTIPTNAQLLVFAFKGIRNNEEAAILMASASAAAMRRSLSHPRSILFMDEASILSKFPALMGQVAKIAANGAKAGIRLIMALQTPASIANSKYSADIFANMSTRIIGRIEEADAETYSRIFNIPPEVIGVNCSEAFFPNKSEIYSRWLIEERGKRTFVRSYAPPLLLAAVANNPDEEEAKAAFLAHYPDEIEALKAFAMELILSNQEDRPLTFPKPSVNERPLYVVS